MFVSILWRLFGGGGGKPAWRVRGLCDVRMYSLRYIYAFMALVLSFYILHVPSCLREV